MVSEGYSIQLPAELNKNCSWDRKYYSQAEKEIKAELKGKRQPKKTEVKKMIAAKMDEIQKRNENWADQAKQMDALIDITVFNWEPKDKTRTDVPKFPKDVRPSQCLVLGIKSVLFERYQKTLGMSVDEGKN